MAFDKLFVIVFVVQILILSACSGSGGVGADTADGGVEKPDWMTEGNKQPTVDAEVVNKAYIDQLYEMFVSIMDPENDKIRYKLSNMPPWMGFDRKRTVFYGTPTLEHVGVYRNIGLSVKDGANVVEFSFDVEVVQAQTVNQAPQISGTPVGSVYEGEYYRFVPTVVDDGVGVLSFSIMNQPSWAQFDSNTGILFGSPAFDQAGLYADIQISVSDGEYTARMPVFSIEVNDKNQPPQISAISNLRLGEAQTVDIRFSAIDDDGIVSMVLSNQPDWLQLDASGFRIHGYADYQSAGLYSDIVLAVTDTAGMSSQVSFSIQIDNVNRSPVLQTQQLQLFEDSQLQVQLQAGDPDEDVLRFHLVTEPQHGMISGFDSESGRFSYVPKADYYGSDLIRIAVSDNSGGEDQQDFSIVVDAVNDIPQANNDSISLNKDSSADIAVLDNDSGLGDGLASHELQLSIARQALHGKVEVLSDQRLRYTPLAGFSGLDAFAYQVTDNNQDISIADVSVEVADNCGSNCSVEVLLSWEPGADPVSGYYIYHGKSSGSYQEKFWRSNTDNAVTVNGSGYHYFAVTAVDSNGVESVYSNEVSKYIP